MCFREDGLCSNDKGKPKDREKRMKIMLIRPYSDIKVLTPPIGLMYLMSYIKKYDSKLVDGRLVGKGSVKEAMLVFRPDVIGIGCMTPEASSMLEIASLAKKINKDCVVIVGGPHAHTIPIDYTNNDIDHIVRGGDGELIFNHIITCLDEGEKVSEWNSGLAEISSLRLPDYESIVMDRYFDNGEVHGRRLKEKRYMPIFTSRGCPYGCIYCHSIFGRKVRNRTPNDVIMEIGLLYHKYGIREIHIEDDAFNLDKDRAKRICDLIVLSGFKIKIAFPNGVRIDMMDKELIQKMKAAGVYSISYGIETVTPRLQKMIRKNLDMGIVNDIIRETNRAGIYTHGFFMIGFPTETREEMMDTIRFARESELDDYGISVVVPFKGTEMHRMLENEGYNFNDDYGAYQQQALGEEQEFADRKIAELGNKEMRRMIREHGNRDKCRQLMIQIKKKARIVVTNA